MSKSVCKPDMFYFVKIRMHVVCASEGILTPRCSLAEGAGEDWGKLTRKGGRVHEAVTWSNISLLRARC